MPDTRGLELILIDAALHEARCRREFRTCPVDGPLGGMALRMIEAREVVMAAADNLLAARERTGE